MKKLDPRIYFTLKGAITATKRNQFAGRETIIERSLDALAIDDAHLVLFGERGVGKTSLGWQLHGILSGNTALIQERKLHTRFPVEEYYCVWLTCNKFMEDIGGMIYSLLKDTESYSLRTLFPDIFSNESLIDRITQKYNFNLGVFKAGFDVAPKKESVQEDIKDMKEVTKKDLVTFNLLKDFFNQITIQYNDKKFIVFIDEFDQVQDTMSIGMLLKNINNVKFVIIGIAESKKALIGDHPSITRKLSFASFEVPLFNAIEVNWFFDQVQIRSNNRLIFTEEFKTQVLDDSSGYPWLVQQFGFYSIMQLFRNRDEEYYTIGISEYNFMLEEFLSSELGDDNLRLSELQDTEIQILLLIAETKQGRRDENSIIEKLTPEHRSFYDDAISALTKSEYITKNKKELRFPDPITKILIHLAIRKGLLNM